jgi:hypothetical protein
MRGIGGGGAFDKARRAGARSRFETDKQLIVHVRPEPGPEEPERDRDWDRNPTPPDEPRPRD